MKHHRIGLVAASLLLAFAAQAETIKIGAVQGLSGPPAIVDFGESYLQGNQLALKVLQELELAQEGSSTFDFNWQPLLGE